MSSTYSISPKANDDLDDIVGNVIDKGHLDAALAFLALANETFALLASQPDMGWNCRIRHRELKTARVFRISSPYDKYLIFYHSLEYEIEILRVMHGSQDLEVRIAAEGVS